MKSVNRMILTAALPVIYVGVFIALDVYAFSHSKRANFGLAVLMLFGPLVIRVTYRRLRTHHQRFQDNTLSPHMIGIVIGFLIACGMYVIGAFYVKEPEGQVFFATVLPCAALILLVVSYFGDKISKARRQEQWHTPSVK